MVIEAGDGFGLYEFCEFEVFNGVGNLMEWQCFLVVGNHWPNEPLLRSNMIQDMFITRQDIAYSNQPDYGQRQGLGAEKELKTSEE